MIQAGLFKPRENLPKVVGRLMSSVIIDMPLTEVRVALSKILSLDHLLPDEILVDFLEKRLEQFRAHRAEEARKAIAAGKASYGAGRKIPLGTFDASVFM